MRSILQKGQISIGIIPIAIGGIMFIATLIIAFYSAQAATEEKTAKNTTAIAVLQNTISNTDANVEEIKEDLKDIKRALNIK